MDVRTGEIHEFDSKKDLEEAKRMFNGFLAELDNLPKPNCPHCYGRGYVGRDCQTNLFVVCSCCRKEAMGEKKGAQDG